MTEEKLTYKKKLIEVAIPLDIINNHSSAEKSIRRGNPSALHIWWARRTLSAAKAIILTSLIDDPSNSLSDKEATKERKKLFKLINEVVEWKSEANKQLQKRVKEELIKSTGGKIPPLLDPFAGGGTIPFAGQQLGISSYGIDLNPVATLISKSLCEIPYKFKDHTPISVSNTNTLGSSWEDAKGLSRDVQYYGLQLEQAVRKKISQYYPKTTLGDTVSSWVWCRTIKCPNPACGCQMPLIKSFYLLKKDSKSVCISPLIGKNEINFTITDKKPTQDGTITSTGAVCLMCNSAVSFKVIREEGKKGRIGQRLLALITENKTRKFQDANQITSVNVKPFIDDSFLTTELPDKALGFRVQLYGVKRHRDLFTDRQFFALTTFVKELKNISTLIDNDLKKVNSFPKEDTPLREGGKGKQAYKEAIMTYLALSISKVTNSWSNLCSWNPHGPTPRNTFARQTLSMTWDFLENNPFSNSGGNYLDSLNHIVEILSNLTLLADGEIKNLDSCSTLDFGSMSPIISTDPPYYDNIGYADLSDYFYVWLRKMLGDIWIDLFSTVLTPKSQELIAAPYRFNDDMNKAELFFKEGMVKVLRLIKDKQNNDYPITIYYAFKQTESEQSEDVERLYASTGWETMLDGILKSGLSIVGTWPIRTERSARPRGVGANALSSSIVIVCRPRSDTASISTRREFINSLKKELPRALKNLQEAGIAPVDMAQSAIGPGMAVFSKYSKVLEADGNPMSMKTALQIINQELDAYFTEQESEMDKETRVCIAWYEQYCWKEGLFGDANTLSNAKGTAVNALEQAGVIYAKAGKVRLLKRTELDSNWDPTTDKKLTIWECVQYLIKALEDKGEAGAAEILKKIGGLSEPVKELAYRLYALCEKKGWNEDGLAYNSLISSWQSITDKAQFAAEISESTKKKIKEKSQKKLTDL